MNSYLVFVLAVIVGNYLLELLADWLNLRNVSPTLPLEFEGWYDAGKYSDSQRYLRDRTAFGIVSDTFSTAITLAFITAGGFNVVDRLARSPGRSEIPTGILFTGILAAGAMLIGLPFSIYGTFVLEEKYGFNKTTPRTFILDLIKSLLLTAMIGAPLFALVLWFFQEAGPLAWVYCWVAVTLFQFFLVFIAPYTIMPLFNKFTPLEDGELKSAIEAYAKAQGFVMKGIFKMDGSRRSAKSNAFFTGFGKSRRIVLFDTLIATHTVPELVAVLAHEMGHYKKKHIQLSLVRSTATTGLMFALLSLFIGNTGLSAAFGMEHVSIYSELVFFGFIYTPVSMALGILGNWISRAHEREADAYAAATTGSPDALITGLKKLCVHNLSNLTPHPLTVFLHHGHPPVLERIRSLKLG